MRKKVICLRVYSRFSYSSGQDICYTIASLSRNFLVTELPLLFMIPIRKANVRKLFSSSVDRFMLSHSLTYQFLGKHRKLDRIRDARDRHGSQQGKQHPPQPHKHGCGR